MAEVNPYDKYLQPEPPANDAVGNNPYAKYLQPGDRAAQGGETPSDGQTSTADYIRDVAKQIPAGLVEGVANIPTAIPRLLNAAGPAISSAIESVVAKVSPERAAEMHEQERQREAFVAAHKPPSVGDYLPAPQTLPGQLARTGAEFVPAMAAAPGSLARNAATGTIAGVASEAAGQATKDTAAEPYARVGGGMIGGIGAAGALAPKAAELLPEQVIKAGSEAYKSPDVANVLIRPHVAMKISNDILGELDKVKLNNRLAPQTRSIVEDLATPIGGVLHSPEDFQTTRYLLGKVAGNFNNPVEQEAASRAIKSLDQKFNSIPQSDLAAGDIAKATETLEQGRGDYAAGKAAERVQTKIDNAELQASSAHSGGNIDNATRQKLRTILTSKKEGRGFTPEEFDQIDQVVRGSTPGNVLRATGKMLGGGGGLGSLVSAAEGMHVAGPIGAAMPLVGYGVKRVGDALTTRAAADTVQKILSRAPSAAALQPQMSPTLGLRRSALLSALLGGTTTPQTPALPVPQLPSRNTLPIQQ